MKTYKVLWEGIVRSETEITVPEDLTVSQLYDYARSEGHNIKLEWSAPENVIPVDIVPNKE